MLLNYFSLAESPRKRPQTPPKPNKVGISQIASVVAEVYGSRLVAGPGVEQPTIPLQQKLLICTFLLMTKERNTKEVVLGKVGFEFQVSFFHMLTNRTGISWVISYLSTCRYTISWQFSRLSFNMSINIYSCLLLFHRKHIEISWTHRCSCVFNTGYFKFNKGPTAFWQILSRYIMYKVLPRSPNLDPLLEEFCYQNDAPFKNIPKFNTDTFKRLFLFHCWYSMNTHARGKNELFLSNPYLIK